MLTLLGSGHCQSPSVVAGNVLELQGDQSGDLELEGDQSGDINLEGDEA